MPPKVVHVRDRVRGAVFIGRPGPYGNPFIIGGHGSRADVIERFRQFILDDTPERARLRDRVRRELRGKDLACFCSPLPCHGDVLLEIANAVEECPQAAPSGDRTPPASSPS